MATWLAGRLAPGDRDDVVQDALLRAWQKRSQFDPARGTPRAWILAIVADQARRHRRRRSRSADLVPVEESVPPAADRVDIERAVGRLPERQQLAVNCFYFADLTVAETAVVMNCTEGTVKSTLFDARSRLRRDLEEQS